MVFTKYTHLQNDEIVCAVLNSKQPTELEVELAQRLGDLLDDNDELSHKLRYWNPYMRKEKKGYGHDA